MKVIKTDVAIMGSGVAGMGAAYKLVQAEGLKVTIFEKYPAQGGAVSNCPMCFCSTPDTPEAQSSAYHVLAKFSNYTANLGLVSKAVKCTAEFPDLFFNKLGIHSLMKVDRDPADYGNERGYTIGHANGLDVGDIYFLEGRGYGHAFALVMLRLRRLLEKQGVEFHFSTPIKEIIQDENGKVVGAYAYEKDGTKIEIQCKALIVASGGISGNMEMMKELGVLNTKFEDAYDEKIGSAIITFPYSCQDGDGHKAVWAVGGKKTGITVSADTQIPNPGVHSINTVWTHAESLKTATEQPYLRVTELGKRFINEDMSNNHTCMSSNTSLNAPNMACYMIFDEDTVKKLAESCEKGYVYFILPDVKVEGIREQIDRMNAAGNRHVCHFDTIHEVCEYMGIDEANLKKTIEKYNHAAEIGFDEEFYSDPKYLRPVREESGQIYCIRMVAGGYDTLGGIAIDDNANVVDANNRPIEGLFAGGDIACGSLFGNPPSNVGGTVYGSMSTGMVAGIAAAEYVKGAL